MVEHEARKAKCKAIAKALDDLSYSQLSWIEGVVKEFSIRPGLYRNPDSDLITPCVLEAFGDALQIHHCFSAEPLSKDRFEYAFHRALNRCGIPSTLEGKCNPGHDITVDGTPISLKTQADKGLKEDFLHISKFMELGKGEWTDKLEQLEGLRERFFAHMNAYERILQLRRLVNSQQIQKYELVEIPKELLLKAKSSSMKMEMESTQGVKPGKCTVVLDGEVAFELYFDGGSERKLQIKKVRKSLCFVHAVWEIKRVSPSKGAE